ncbi:MAG: hypothetical protein HYR91_03055 [Flavobacteriia bacterium]|nr:hypothetical protein [Flavobacteriia bacterium]
MLTKNNTLLILGILIVHTFGLYAQDGVFEMNRSKIKIKKSGPYIGIQKGKYTNLEIGLERQWKAVKLIKPVTNALHLGINYNLTNNVLGYEMGYWCKVGRLNFTYGGNLLFMTNFSQNRIGFTPVIGYKILGFHLQTGCNLLTYNKNFQNVNTFFVALKFVIINNRDVDIKK